MHPLLKDIRHNPLLWLLVFVPVVFAAHKFKAEAHTLLFMLSVLAIVPLAALLSHATESVAVETGDTVGGLLNATLGKPDRTGHCSGRPARGAIHAGEGVRRRRHRHQYPVYAGHLVSARRTQASHAGVQPGERSASGRPAVSRDRCLDCSLGRRSCGRRLAPAFDTETESRPVGAAHRSLCTRPIFLTQDPSRIIRQREARRRATEAPWPLGLALGHSRASRCSSRWSARSLSSRCKAPLSNWRCRRRSWGSSSWRWWAARRKWPPRFPARKKPVGLERRHRAGKRSTNRHVRRASSRAAQLFHRTHPNGICNSGRAPS